MYPLTFASAMTRIRKDIILLALLALCQNNIIICCNASQSFFSSISSLINMSKDIDEYKSDESGFPSLQYVTNFIQHIGGRGSSSDPPKNSFYVLDRRISCLKKNTAFIANTFIDNASFIANYIRQDFARRTWLELLITSLGLASTALMLIVIILNRNAVREESSVQDMEEESSVEDLVIDEDHPSKQLNEDDKKTYLFLRLSRINNVHIKTIGRVLYPIIFDVYPEYARRVTNRLLKMERSKLMRLVKNPKALASKIQEAIYFQEYYPEYETEPQIEPPQIEDENIDQASTESADAVLYSWFEEGLEYATTNDDRKKIIDEHFSPLIKKTQPKHDLRHCCNVSRPPPAASKILDMLYNTDNDELLELYQQYLYGHLSVLDDKIKLMKIEEDKRVDRNRKKKAKKRQRKKKEAEANTKQLEETKQKKEGEAIVAASKVKQKEHAEAERFEHIKAVSTEAASVCSDHQQEDVDAPTPSDMNAATQEHDVSMATASKSIVPLNSLSKEADPLPNQYVDVPGVTECLSSALQDENKSVQEEDSALSKIDVNDTQDTATRETITEVSISSLNDRRKAPKALSTVDMNENDPLRIFLNSQHQCIRGSVDEFYTWLVKSEDIDSMMALKEAVSEEEYLNNKMKKGSGSSGVKGFKLKPFQRAVREYFSDKSDTKSSGHHSLPQCQSKSQEPPDELVCPISLVLMTNDPVLAADGITYERSSIEDWFKKSKAKGNIIYSPVHGTKLKKLALTPNIGTRNMARAFKDEK